MVKVSMPNIEAVQKALESKRERVRKALKNTIYDMAKRAPGWIATEVTGVYGIKKAEIMPTNKNAKRPQKKAGRVGMRGETVDSLYMVYKGRPLTPTHFKMKPVSRPTGNKPYNVTAEIFKGQRKQLSRSAFIGSNKGGGGIPFIREGAARLPIQAIKTISLPQMVTSDKIADKIEEKLQDGLAERFYYHMGRAGSK